MIINRRKFILTAISGLILLFFYRLSGKKNSKAPELSDLIQKKLSYLNVDKSEIEKFLNDYTVYSRTAGAANSGIEGLCSLFLLSSNFFIEVMPAEIKYLSLYAPELRPCSNPFARFNS